MYVNETWTLYIVMKMKTIDMCFSNGMLLILCYFISECQVSHIVGFNNFEFKMFSQDNRKNVICNYCVIKKLKTTHDTYMYN